MNRQLRRLAACIAVQAAFSATVVRASEPEPSVVASKGAQIAGGVVLKLVGPVVLAPVLVPLTMVVAPIAIGHSLYKEINRQAALPRPAATDVPALYAADTSPFPSDGRYVVVASAPRQPVPAAFADAFPPSERYALPVRPDVSQTASQ
jgi:hypothetical protein